MNGSDIGSIISGLTSASVIGYDISQGTPVSSTLGPEGASITTTGISPTTLLLIGIIVVGIIAVLLLR